MGCQGSRDDVTRLIKANSSKEPIRENKSELSSLVDSLEDPK